MKSTVCKLGSFFLFENLLISLAVNFVSCIRGTHYVGVQEWCRQLDAHDNNIGILRCKLK